MDEAIAGIGTLVDKMGWASPPPKSRGGSELQLWLKDRCTELGSGRSEDSLHSVGKGVKWNMGGGSKGQPSGVCNFLRSRGGLALLLCLCLVLRLSDGLSCLHNLSHLLLLVWSPSWSGCRGDRPRGRSEVCQLSLFLDLSRSLSWFLSQPLSLVLWLSLSLHSVVRSFNSLSKIHTVGFPHVVLLSTVMECQSK